MKNNTALFILKSKIYLLGFVAMIIQEEIYSI